MSVTASAVFIVRGIFNSSIALLAQVVQLSVRHLNAVGMLRLPIGHLLGALQSAVHFV
jgi:hypothetical protein